MQFQPTRNGQGCLPLDQVAQTNFYVKIFHQKMMLINRHYLKQNDVKDSLEVKSVTVIFRSKSKETGKKSIKCVCKSNCIFFFFKF